MVPAQTNAWGGWPVSFQFSDGSNHNNLTGVNIGTLSYTNNLGSSFAGLAGYYMPCTITSKATALGQLYNVSATVQEQVQANIIPLFQFAIFYNMDMDVSPGQAMNIGGNVFCNANIWMWPYAAMVFSNNVDAAGWVTNHMQPYDQQSSSGYVAAHLPADRPACQQGGHTDPADWHQQQSERSGANHQLADELSHGDCGGILDQWSDVYCQ